MKILKDSYLLLSIDMSLTPGNFMYWLRLGYGALQSHMIKNMVRYFNYKSARLKKFIYLIKKFLKTEDSVLVTILILHYTRSYVNCLRIKLRQIISLIRLEL